MSSVLVSNYMGMKERLFQQEVSAQNAALSQQYLDLLSQASETSGLGKTDLPGCRGGIPANGVSVPPITRRHSSSMFVSNSTPLTPLTEATGFFSNVLGSGLETVTEERFRSRAFSEGASMLNCDPSFDQQQQAQSSSSRYKTELCRPFEENGRCKYGDKCQFAHGKHELRHMVRHPKYKTELCRTYHTTGLCPYGPRCHFIHNQDEPTVGLQRQIAARIQQTASAPVSITNPIQRQTSLNRPSNLQLISQQRGAGRLNSYSYSPPLETQSPFFGVNENAVLSPMSPLGGQTFNYNKFPLSSKTNNFGRMSETRQPSPIQDFAALGQLTDLSGSDDHVFDSPLTPPDSDRESATGSPPGFAAPAPCPQRLPIFRCLSQSE